MAAAGRRQPSIKTLWAIAKSPELALSEDDLHAVVYRETGKESMRQLTQGEIKDLARVLQNMKDSTRPLAQKPGKRTDEGGNPQTILQRRKIYMLTGALGWNDTPARLDGFIWRMFRVSRLEWLTAAQCYKLIEALKKMAEREEKADGK